jgi:Na+/pantothenate symporter
MILLNAVICVTLIGLYLLVRRQSKNPTNKGIMVILIGGVLSDLVWHFVTGDIDVGALTGLYHYLPGILVVITAFALSSRFRAWAQGEQY